MSRPAILRALEAGFIVIDPFDERNLNTASYDVTLGENIYRERTTEFDTYQFHAGWSGMYNPYDEEAVKRCWGAGVAQLATSIFSDKKVNQIAHYVGVPKGIHPDDKVILISPQELILAHTIEFIGTTTPHIRIGLQHTTEMHSRSSSVRNFIDVCGSGGFGDLGYANRWTMEIKNNSRYQSVPLIVGRRYAQISFFQTEPLPSGESYTQTGKYQTKKSLEELKKNWRPEMMLPRMYLDREVMEK
jgi:deoxycytidine triphosphate deaminase